jgi:hypothetical protein
VLISHVRSHLRPNPVESYDSPLIEPARNNLSGLYLCKGEAKIGPD